MVKRFLIKLLLENSGKILKSVQNAYRSVTQSRSNVKSNDQGKSIFEKMSLQNLISTPMTKVEALKILDLNPTKQEINPEIIIQKFETIVKQNNPEKGGSFYIQNKAYYAKEFLMEDFPKEDNVSEYNPKI